MSPAGPIDEPRRVGIVGAGPAGAFLARLLADDGIKVEVYDGATRLALKPCGWGLPYSVEKILRVPGDAILVRVTGYKVYADGNLSKVSHGKFYGYIVDKETLLKDLLEGIEVVRRWVTPEKLQAQGYDLVVDARGHISYHGRKVLALQVEGRLEEIAEDEIQVYFLSEIVGYAWVFPLGNGKVKVGVGGTGDYNLLLNILDRLLRKIQLENPSPVRGSPIAVGGLTSHLKGTFYRIGEAMGAVMPLSGEGIRPSFITALALYEELTGHSGFQETLSRFLLDLNLNLQLAILQTLERSTPKERIAFFEGASQEILERVTAGELTKSFLAYAVTRWPGFFARVAKLAGKNIQLKQLLTGSSNEHEDAA